MREKEDCERGNQFNDVCHTKESTFLSSRYQVEIALTSPDILQCLADFKLLDDSSLPDQAFGVDNGPPG